MLRTMPVTQRWRRPYTLTPSLLLPMPMAEGCSSSLKMSRAARLAPSTIKWLPAGRQGRQAGSMDGQGLLQGYPQAVAIAAVHVTGPAAIYGVGHAGLYHHSSPGRMRGLEP